MSNKISEEDKALFRNAVDSIKPVIKNANHKPEQVLITKHPARKYQLSDAVKEEVGPESVLGYCEPGFPQQRFKDLKLGRMRWEAKLDLHGTRFEDASDTLCDAIEQFSALALRVVLIVHGKGGHHGDLPILKNYVNRWLKQLPQVVAFHTALPKDGGAGALYVLLRKNRK